mgnify:CR=1 FL=1
MKNTARVGDPVAEQVVITKDNVPVKVNAVVYFRVVDPSKSVIEVQNCVYQELAREYPDVVCAFDRGMLCGLLGVDAAAHSQTHALSAGDSVCRHEFRL